MAQSVRHPPTIQETWFRYVDRGRSPGEGMATPQPYACLGNPMDRGALWATVRVVVKSRTRLTRWSRHACVLRLQKRKRKGKEFKGFAKTHLVSCPDSLLVPPHHAVSRRYRGNLCLWITQSVDLALNELGVMNSPLIIQAMT